MTDAARWKATVFVGGLSPLVTSTHLLDAFIPFGEIVEVQLPKPDSRKSEEPHRGFAYVEFEDEDDAKEAIDNMNQSEFFGKILKVSPAKIPKSADEGLGSKKAVWEQVCHHLQPKDDRINCNLPCTHRRAGWQSMLGLSQMEIRQTRAQATAP